MTPPMVGIVVPVRNRRNKTLRFLKSISEQTWPRVLPIVVDSNSNDGTLDAISKAFPNVQTVAATDADFWTGATNRGVEAALAAGCEYVLTINDDGVVREDLVEELVELARTFDLPILACRIDYLNRPGLIWSIGARHNWATMELFALNYHNVREEDLPEIIRDALVIPVESAPGNGVLIHRSVFEKVGLYDEKNTPHYHADTEFLLRCRMHGFTPRVSPKIIVYNDTDPEFSVDGGAVTEDLHWKRQLTFNDLRKVVRSRQAMKSLYWMLTKRKSHFFFRAHAYVIRRYCPQGLRWRSLVNYLAGVVFLVLDSDPRSRVATLLKQSNMRLRRERLERAVSILAGSGQSKMRKRGR